MKISVTARDSEHAFECREGEKILHAGLRAGVALPYECGSGTCGTCKAVLARGEVDGGWPAAPGREHLKAERNEILMCQSVARSDCALELRGRVGEMTAPQPGHVGGVIETMEFLNREVVRLDVRLDAPVDFEAGQFMLVGIDGLEGLRGLSMTNYDRPAERVFFTVKLVPGGGLSEWLRAGGRADEAVTLFGPLGKAFYRPKEDTNMLFIAGGSGLAPTLSILARAKEVGHFERHEGHIFFGTRTVEDLYAMDELMSHRAAFPHGLALNVVLSEEGPTAGLAHQFPNVSFASGLVHEIAGRAMVGKYGDMTAFLAGPPPMVDGALRMLVTEARMPPSRIRYDKFS